jgi:hemerythrin-like domain-containing protein
MGSAAVREFTGIHSMIRGLVHLMDTSLSKARPANSQQMRVVAELGLFAVAGTRFHHQGEDTQYWPAVIANGADAAAFDSLSAEHHELDPLLDNMDRASKSLKAEPTDRRAFDALRQDFGPYRDHVLEHLNNEEPIFFPLLDKFLPDDQAEVLARGMAKSAPREGITWLMGGVEYGMTKEQAAEFLKPFPKPIVWLRPMFLRRYRKDCRVLGVEATTPSER